MTMQGTQQQYITAITGFDALYDTRSTLSIAASWAK